MRYDKSYIPSIKPFLLWRFLDEFPEEEENNFLYIDSDVIFREMINLKDYEEDNNTWIGSNCSGYLSADYIKQCKNGEEILQHMCNIVGIKVSDAEYINKNMIGAQLIIKKPKAEFWKKTYLDSIKIWKYFETIDSNIQKWTAEMWSQCYNMSYFSINQLGNSEFNFTWATDPADYWYKNKIFHNAGVDYSDKNMFFKSKYIEKTPFFDDFSQISDKKASYFYVKAIKDTIKNTK